MDVADLFQVEFHFAPELIHSLLPLRPDRAENDAIQLNHPTCSLGTQELLLGPGLQHPIQAHMEEK
jgi:hypothetical protein